MTPQHIAMMDRFYAQHLGSYWKETAKPVHLTCWQVVEALWPMNDVFRPRMAMLESLAYNKDCEVQADEAIAAYVNGSLWHDDSPPPPVWRVLLERHTQTITLALANEAAGNTRLMTVPDSLAKDLRMNVAILFFQYQMALPYPVSVSPVLLWPQGPAPASLRKH